MKNFLLIAVLVSNLILGGCKKDTTEEIPETTITSISSTDNPTEGTVKIADNNNGSVKYDDKTITVKSFDISKTLGTVLTSYAQFTIQSTDKDGIFDKYTIGINLLSGLPKTGETISVLSGTTPLIGLNVYENSSLYPFSAMNGTFKVESNDGKNLTILVSDMDMKQSYTPGFEASAKRLKVKAFRFKFSY